MDIKGKATDLAAVAIAVAAICVSIWQVGLSREHNKLSVRPFIGIWHQDSQFENPGWMMYNSGLGPAFIVSSRIWYKGEVLSGGGVCEGFLPELGVSFSAWECVKERLISDTHVYEEVRSDGSRIEHELQSIGFQDLEFDGLTCGDVLAEKSETHFLKEGNSVLPTHRNFLYNNINIEVCYCSFHGECFHASPTEGDKTDNTDPRICPKEIDVDRLMNEKSDSKYCHIQK